jgi:hypothetical protein
VRKHDRVVEEQVVTLGEWWREVDDWAYVSNQFSVRGRSEPVAEEITDCLSGGYANLNVLAE